MLGKVHHLSGATPVLVKNFEMYCFERYIVEVSMELIGPLGYVFAYHRPHPKDGGIHIPPVDRQTTGKTVPLVPGPFPGGGVVPCYIQVPEQFKCLIFNKLWKKRQEFSVLFSIVVTQHRVQVSCTSSHTSQF